MQRVNTYASQANGVDEILLRRQRSRARLKLPPDGQRERLEGVRVLPDESARVQR